MAEVLLASGADPNATDRTLNDPVIHYAAFSGNIPVAGVLLSRGVDVNVRNRRTGAAAIHYAAEMSKPEMIRFLAASGADLAPIDSIGFTPYGYADRCHQFRAMAVLQELGAPQEIAVR